MEFQMFKPADVIQFAAGYPQDVVIDYGLFAMLERGSMRIMSFGWCLSQAADTSGATSPMEAIQILIRPPKVMWDSRVCWFTEKTYIPEEFDPDPYFSSVGQQEEMPEMTPVEAVCEFYTSLRIFRSVATECVFKPNPTMMGMPGLLAWLEAVNAS